MSTYVVHNDETDSVNVFTSEDTMNNPFLDPSLVPPASETTVYAPDGSITTVVRQPVNVREPIYEELPAAPVTSPAYSQPNTMSPRYGVQQQQQQLAFGYQEPARSAQREGIYDEIPAARSQQRVSPVPQQQQQQQQQGPAVHAEDQSASEPQTVPLLTGQLPDDFLRLTERAPVPRQPFPGGAVDPAYQTHHMHAPRQGIVRITVVQAKLAKNYGLMRMDPFCRFISGPFHKTTSVCVKGGKEPRWNQILDVPLLMGTENIRVEMFDMGTFSDSMIAWGDIDISGLEPAIPLEKWFHLSGKQGEDKEGVILLRLVLQPTTYAPVGFGLPFMPQAAYPGQTIVYQVPDNGFFSSDSDVVVSYPAPPVVSGPPLAYPSQRVIVQQQQPMPQPLPPRPAAAPLKVEDVRQLREMFPSMDEEIVKSVLAANNGNLEASINALLSMASVS